MRTKKYYFNQNMQKDIYIVNWSWNFVSKNQFSSWIFRNLKILQIQKKDSKISLHIILIIRYQLQLLSYHYLEPIQMHFIETSSVCWTLLQLRWRIIYCFFLEIYFFMFFITYQQQWCAESKQCCTPGDTVGPIEFPVSITEILHFNVKTNRKHD